MSRASKRAGGPGHYIDIRHQTIYQECTNGSGAESALDLLFPGAGGQNSCIYLNPNAPGSIEAAGDAAMLAFCQSRQDLCHIAGSSGFAVASSGNGQLAFCETNCSAFSTQTDKELESFLAWASKNPLVLGLGEPPPEEGGPGGGGHEGAAAASPDTAVSGYTIRSRVSQALANAAKLGPLAGQLAESDIAALADSPSAQRFFDMRNGYYQVVNEVNGRLVPMSVDAESGTPTIFSLSLIRSDQLQSLIANGGYIPLG